MLKHKSESLRLRFVLIIIICLTDFCRYWRPVRPSPTGSKTGAEHLFQKRSEKYLIEIRKGLLGDHVNIATR